MVRVRTLSLTALYRNSSIIRGLIGFSSVLFILCFTSVSFAQTLTYEGTLFDSTDAVIAESGVRLKAEIFDNALVCVLYEREYALDLSSSAGQFSLDLSAGTAPSAQPHTANTLAQILSNAAGNNVTCANSLVRSFSGAFVKRQVRISVLEINGVDITDIQLPAQDLEMVAFAGEAETSKKFTGAITGDVIGTSSTTKVTGIQGVTVDATSPTDGQFLKYDNSSGKYIPAVINSAVIADNSVSVDDVDFASTSGIDLPTLSAAPGAPSAGQIYYNSVDNKVYFYNGSGWINTGAGGGDFLSSGAVAFSGNIKLNGNYLSGDGDNEGVFVESSTGNVGIGIATPSAKLDVSGAAEINGQLNMVNNKIANLATPTVSTDAATKSYVDTTVSANGNGDFMANGSVAATADFALGTNKITGVGDPALAQDAATKNYVDTQGFLTSESGDIQGITTTTGSSGLSGGVTTGTASLGVDITGTTAESSVAGGDEILIYDASATALKKMTRANFISGIDTTLSEATVDGYANNNGYLTSETGDIQGVTAGTGLSGGGTTGTPTLSVDTSYVQRRVSSSCSAGSSIRAIATDGSVTCEASGGGSIVQTTNTCYNYVMTGPSTCTTSCPAGYTRSGCSGSNYYDTNTFKTHAYPEGSNACRCYSEYRVRCYVYCIKIQ